MSKIGWTRGLSPRACALALTGLAAAALLLLPSRADACGGLFCNGGPPNPFAPLPIAQNGENVVFAITKDPKGGAPTIDAHIQILYTGDAAKFSWVVPVDSVPTLGTGTDLLFSQLQSLTRPLFQPIYETEGKCMPYPVPAYTSGAAGSTGSAGTTGTAGSTGTAGPGVQVAFQGAVGPFEAAVVKSDDPTALKKWLTDNAYVVSDQASVIIDSYVQENKYFVALKLLNGVGVNQIQPITLTFQGTEACVPLRLTAIAANLDMPVLVFVLGDTRVAPRGFHELEIDDASIDWPSFGGNYVGSQGLVSRAANEAGGKAFITEYAGPATIATAGVYRNGAFDLNALKNAMTPPVYVQALVGMGLATDPLMLGLLQKFIPMPDAAKQMNLTPIQFYGNLQMYWNQFAFPPYDLPGLTDAISTSIIQPRVAAQMMIDTHPMLTRLQTFISPDEMDADPFFFEAQTLPNLSNVHTATIRTLCSSEYLECNAPQRLELSDGRQIMMHVGVRGTSCTFPSGPYPDFVKSLPAASVAWDRELMGDGTAVLDNRTKIKNAVDAYNASFGSTGIFGPSGTPGGGGVIDGNGGGGGGCSCDVGAGTSGLTLAAAAGALGLVLSRLRRRR